MIAALLDTTAGLLSWLASAPGPASWRQAGARMVTADRSEIGRYAAEQGSRLNAEQGLLILGGLVVMISSASLVVWITRRRPPVPVVLLFNRLAREAGLGAGDRWLLYRIVRQQGRIAQQQGRPPRGRRRAALLAPLLCPGTLGAWARDHAHAQTGRRRHSAAQLARAASIRRHLFGPVTAH